MDALLNTTEVARLLGVAEITLRHWRVAGEGPQFVKVGRNCRYRKADVEDWVSDRCVPSTSEPAR